MSRLEYADHEQQPSVLIVCAGNTCRSAMAAAILRRARPDLDVSSAGLYASAGEPATEEAIAEMARRGIDLRGHRAERLTMDAALAPEVVACMESSHVAAVRK